LFVEELHISAADLVAFCKLLDVIDLTMTYSKSAFTLCPRDTCFYCTDHHWFSGI